jgi:hypothetical protein
MPRQAILLGAHLSKVRSLSCSAASEVGRHVADLTSSGDRLTCSSCGKEVRRNARFCRNCGSAIGASADAAGAATRASGVQEKSSDWTQTGLSGRNRLPLLGGAGAAALGVVVALLLARSLARPTSEMPSQGAQGVSASLSSSAGANRQIVLSDANTKDIWSTSVYSYAPGGGGPGGGREDERLRVGGWGDQYVALVRLPVVPLATTPKAVWLNLYDNPDDGQPTAMTLDLITSPWTWKEGDRLWWANLPTSEPIKGVLLPAPTPGAWTRIDVTDLYRSWSKGTTPNYGVLLRPVLNQNNYNNFSSTRAPDPNHRPTLTILY